MALYNLLLLLAVTLASSMADNRGIICNCHYTDIFYTQVDITCQQDSTSKQTSPQQTKPKCSREVKSYLSRNYEYVPGLGFYKVYRTATSYQKAIAKCRQDGATLAVPRSKEEAQAVAAIIQKNPAVGQAYEFSDGQAYIGINDIDNTGTLSSIDGTPLSSLGYSEWAPRQPDNNGGSGQCVTINREGLYSDERCSGLVFSFVCHRRPLSPLPPDGYKYIWQLGFYKLYKTPQNYTNARQQCLNDGGHLAVIDTQDEADELHKLYDFSGGLRESYVGFNDIEQEGFFVSETGKPMKSLPFDNWYPGEPNNAHNGENCVTFYIAGTMNDVICDLEYPFFCEIELTKV